MNNTTCAGKFSGILLCSDFDGTLVPSAENIAALEYFTQNGGLFTMASGRYPKHFRETVKGLPINAPMVALNGNAIYDLSADRVLWSNPIPDELTERIIRFTVENFPEVQSLHVNALTHGLTYKRADFQDGIAESNEYHTADELLAVMAADNTLHPAMKLLAICRTNFTPELRARYETAFPMLTFVLSGGRGLEMYLPTGGKGNAVARLRELLGGREAIHTVVCVGDYENDIGMIEYANIGYAVANACEPLKAAADRITVSYKENAIARIIADLDNETNKE
ncbi:MAG: HAD-IIB family hydrolase [Clostridia bacterium]|nr:HAD-IIB family hydrolase [Clostridia bacterium]